MESKEVLKYCPNYYNIVNFDSNEGNIISEKLINIYKSYVFSVNLSNQSEINKVAELDRVLGNYIKDLTFRGVLQKEIVTAKVKKDENVLRNIVDIIINIFTRYEEYTTRKIYISKWI